MTKTLCLTLVLLTVGLLATGCAGAYPTQPMMGWIYSDVKAPLSAHAGDFGSRSGSATCTSILGWITTGDASVRAAAAAGGITNVKHVDFHAKSVLGVYGEFTVIVYGD